MSESYYIIPKNRQRVKMTDAMARRYNFPLAEDQTDPSPAAEETKQPGKCRECQGRGGVVFMSYRFGLVFYGLPKWERLRLVPNPWGGPFPRVILLDTPGCGCWKLLKDLADALPVTLGRVWRGYRLAVESAKRARGARRFSAKLGLGRTKSVEAPTAAGV